MNILGTLWIPDIHPYNDIGLFDANKFLESIPLTVDHMGLVGWYRPVSFETTCSLDVTTFPYDSQECVITIGSWQYDYSEVQIRCEQPTLDISGYSSHSLWELKGVYNLIFKTMLSQLKKNNLEEQKV